ncbi:MAG: hypothetical protein AAFY08_11935 [Planctomycetota bacterium]
MGYSTHEQLASAAGVSRPTVTRDLKRPDCPLGPGPWDNDDVAELLAWRAGRAEARGLGTSCRRERDRWLARRYRAQALAIEGGLCDVRAMLADGQAWRQRVRDRLALAAKEAAPACVGREVHDVESAIDAAIRRALDGVADEMLAVAGEGGAHDD